MGRCPWNWVRPGQGASSSPRPISSIRVGTVQSAGREQQDALLSTTLSTTLLWLVQLTRAFVLKPKQGEVGAGLSHGPFPALPFSMPFASPAEQMVLIFFFYIFAGGAEEREPGATRG